MPISLCLFQVELRKGNGDVIGRVDGGIFLVRLSSCCCFRYYLRYRWIGSPLVSADKVGSCKYGMYCICYKSKDPHEIIRVGYN